MKKHCKTDLHKRNTYDKQLDWRTWWKINLFQVIFLIIFIRFFFSNLNIYFYVTFCSALNIFIYLTGNSAFFLHTEFITSVHWT